MSAISNIGSGVAYNPPLATGQDFISAIKRNDLATIKRLLGEGFDPFTVQDEDRLTPLHWAVRMHFKEAVSLLADLSKEGAGLGVRNGIGQTALDLAISVSARQGIPETLIEKMAPSDLMEGKGNQPSAYCTLAMGGSLYKALDKRITTCFSKTVELLTAYWPEFTSLPKEQKDQIIEYLRRVKKSELLDVLLRIRRLPPLTENQTSALQKLDWSDPIFNDRHIQEYALFAFLSGRLSVEEVSEIFIYDECTRKDSNSHSTQRISLNQEEAFSVLKRALKGHFTDEDIRKFLTDPEVKNGQIYLISIRPNRPNDDTILHVILNAPHRLFTCNTDDGTRQVVLAPRLLSRLYSLKYGQQAPRLNAVLGPSVSYKNFADPSKRDALVPCWLFRLSQPFTADGHRATPLEFWHHDAAYHHFLSCVNPHRAAYLELAREVFNEAPRPAFYFRLFDQEFNRYAKGGNPNDAFFLIINGQFKEGRDKIFAHIAKNQERWATDYGIVLPPEVNPASE